MPFEFFPNSNFHDMNLDYVLEKTKDIEDNVKSAADSASAAADSADAAALSEKNAADSEAAAALSEQNAANSETAAKNYADNIADPVAGLVTSWLDDNVDPGTGYVIDSSLTISGAAADAKATGAEISELKSALIDLNSYDFLLSLTKTNETKSGITYTWSGDECTVTGTAAAQNFSNIFGSNTTLPNGMVRGGTYYVDFSSQNVEFEILQMSSSGSVVQYLVSGTIGYGWFTIPSDASGVVIRLLVRNGKTVNETVSPKILNFYSNEKLTGMLDDETLVYKGSAPANTDINTVENGLWLLTTGRSYSNSPIADTQYGTLLCFKEDNVTFQIIYAGGSDNGKSYIRSWINSNYSQWQRASGGVENNYTFNEYANTYNVTANPTITTDTNNFLTSTGDTTDVTASIVAMLTQSGVCRLGKGDYYVDSLVMPSGTAIIGSGYATRIILKDPSDGFAIKMGSQCVVKDLQILGDTSDITVSSQVGNRHGILWQGTYTQNQTAPFRGIVDNVFIRNFNGGGITCYDTGYGTYNCLEVTNVYIWLCNAGINISYWSEFHKFTNVRTGACYYGCINNGGNNIFVNCDFSSNKLGFLMDNSQSQSPNNSHGSAIGCVFNHSDSNSGTGIKILNCDSGYVFTGCQIFYSKIEIEDSDGVVVSDSNFGLSNCDISVNGGGTVLFTNNMHQGTPTISIQNNSYVRFVNCYNRSTGAVISN